LRQSKRFARSLRICASLREISRSHGGRAELPVEIFIGSGG
jgi:hypothetical protein